MTVFITVNSKKYLEDKKRDLYCPLCGTKGELSDEIGDGDYYLSFETICRSCASSFVINIYENKTGQLVEEEDFQFLK